VAAIVRLENVKKSYQLGETRVDALRGINFDLEKGDFRALLGASGSGKSTLLHLIATLDVPDEGRLMFLDTDLAKASEEEKSDIRNSKIAMIFQNFNLIAALNVKQNVELPLILRNDISFDEKVRRVLNAIEDVGLKEFMHHRPDQLSGGQRQRVAIARALVPEPELILADEPTANLDSKTANQVIDLLLDLNSKRHITFLFATHDEKLIKRVKNLSWIVDGEIKEQA
jgi:putative ABC transport system ATP-binding protein